MNDYLDLKWTFEVPMIDVIQKVVDENKKTHTKLRQSRDESAKTSNMFGRSNKNCQEEMGNSGTRCKRKSVESCGERHLRRIKRKRAASCVASLAWLESEDCVPLKLTVQNRQSGVIETSVLNEEACRTVFGQEHILDQEMDIINMILFVKDRFHISGQAYHELAKICKALPRHWKLKE